VNIGDRLNRLEGKLPGQRPATHCGLTLEQLRDPQVRELAADLAAVMAGPGGEDRAGEVDALKAKLDGRVRELEQAGGEVQ